MLYQDAAEPAQNVQEYIMTEFYELLLVNAKLKNVMFGLHSRFVKCLEMLTRQSFFRSKRNIKIIYQEHDGQGSGALIDVSLRT